MLKLFFILTLSFFMLACSSSSDESVTSQARFRPEIGEINTTILHSHPSFHNKWGVSPARHIRFSVSVEVFEPQGLDNLASVLVRENQDDFSWSFFGGPVNIPLEECYLASISTFECVFYSSTRLDTILLEDWEIVAEDENGNIATKVFSFRVPGGELPETERFVFSAEYGGSASSGVAALEAMTIVDNNMVFTSDPGTQTFHIEFETTDSRVSHYELAFYDLPNNSSDVPEYVGTAVFDGLSISSTPIVLGQPVELDLNWSEIEFDEGFDATDVNGLHIKLLDTPSDTISGPWFTHAAYSEYIEL